MSTDIQVSKFGDGLALVIPDWVAQEAKICEGDKLELSLSPAGEITLRSSIRHYDLEELVSKITDDNRHEETDWGPPVGNEVW